MSSPRPLSHAAFGEQRADLVVAAARRVPVAPITHEREVHCHRSFHVEQFVVPWQSGSLCRLRMTRCTTRPERFDPPSRPCSAAARHASNGRVRSAWRRCRRPARLTVSRSFRSRCVLADTEYRDVIAPGVEQRARMLQRLFHDLFAGSATILEGGLLDAAFLERLVSQHGWSVADLQAMWQGRQVADVRFVYGPDLVRAPNGEWLVLEDNIGCIGGVGTAQVVLDAFVAASGAVVDPAACAPVTISPRRLPPSSMPLRMDRSSGSPARRRQASSSNTITKRSARRATLARLGVRVIDSHDESLGAEGAVPAAIVNLGGTLGARHAHAGRSAVRSRDDSRDQRSWSRDRRQQGAAPVRRRPDPSLPRRGATARLAAHGADRPAAGCARWRPQAGRRVRGDGGVLPGRSPRTTAVAVGPACRVVGTRSARCVRRRSNRRSCRSQGRDRGSGSESSCARSRT